MLAVKLGAVFEVSWITTMKHQTNLISLVLFNRFKHKQDEICVIIRMFLLWALVLMDRN